MGSDGEASSPIENAAPNTALVEDLDFSRRIFHVQPSSETTLDDRGGQPGLNEASGLSHHSDTDNNQQAVNKGSGRQEGSKDNVEAIKDGTKPQLAETTFGEAESQLGRNKETPTERLNSQRSPQQPEEHKPKVSHDSFDNLKEKSRNVSSISRRSTMESTKAGSDCVGPESIMELEKTSLEEESIRILQPTTSRGTRKSSDIDPNKAPRNNAVLNELFTDIIASAAPSLRHLASQSTLSESVSSAKRSKTYERPHRLSTPVEEQRHPGKPGLWSDQFMKNIDEMVDWETKEVNAISLSSTSNLDAFGARAKTEKNEEVVAPPEPQELDAEIEYPGTLALTILTIGLCLSVLLISLDRTIITTAIPYISGEFHSYADVGWYGSAYLLTACAFQPMYGRIFTIFSIKWSYLGANALFEIGSLICGVAPNSLTLIIGRAIAGVGSAGILTGSFVVVAHSVPIQRRPVFTAAVGLMFGLGATVGPLMGGVFTDKVSWRWCFYFNLPVGCVTILAMILFFNPKNSIVTKRSFGSRVLDLDILGNILLLGACVMLFIAFQHTEEGNSWSSAMVIGLLVGFSVTMIVLGLWFWYRGDKALVPLEILKQRTVLASCLFSFFLYSALIIHGYYLPQWFQAIKNTSAITSGVDMIPYVLCNAFFSLVAGVLVSKSGYFTPPAIIGTAIATIGCGFISTFRTDTTSAEWIGYELLSSTGFGIAIQQGFTAVQTVLPLEKIPIGTAAVVASQSFGGAVFVSVGNTILQNQLKASYDSGQLPGINIQAVLDAGATGFRSVVDADQLPALLEVYNGALQKVFIAAIPVTALAFISSLFLEWKSVKTQESTEQV
ncbi:putative major facilitator superfamily transporter protein [Botrytis fragariae]|uniref:Putative major facilitator superfamily transporter protein n=1 Tax=Botrytis fragariae TaxID=1964551 RepID=A0A8H6EDW5_9HELO|nr:putative major facilitator superfamily transporter protein [Botrytis fragariae]KAF5868754.1 putative major facilitator superfamily transporter protein [Botrytis fragariae]